MAKSKPVTDSVQVDAPGDAPQVDQSGSDQAVAERVVLTESMSDGTEVYWFSVTVPGNGDVPVRAVSEEVASRLAQLYFRKAVGKVGYRKRVPVFGERRIMQVPCKPPRNVDGSAPKDIREEARRDGLDYIVC